MRVKAVVNKAGLRTIEKNARIALEQAAEATKTDVIAVQVIPFAEGDMQNHQTFIDRKSSGKGVVRIVTDAPQARRLYYHPEYNFQTKNNPNAKGKWLDDHINGNKKDFAKKAFASRLRKLNGGGTK